MEELSKDNALLYAAKHYDGKLGRDDELIDDLNKAKVVSRLLRKYQKYGEQKHRLVLNNIILVTNVFGVIPGVNLLFLCCHESCYGLLNTYIRFLGLEQNYANNINCAELKTDNKIWKALQVL